MRRSVLQTFRITHLYFGVFIAPAILFFAFTGALQSFGLHETDRDHPNYKPAHWIVVLSQIHKKQSAIIPVRKPQPKPTEALPPPAAIPPTATPARPEVHHNPVPLRIFFVLVCLGLFTSTITGLYMAYTYNRDRRLVTLTLIAGIVIPPLLLLF